MSLLDECIEALGENV